MKVYAFVGIILNFAIFSLQKDDSSKELAELEEKIEAITQECMKEFGIDELPDSSSEEDEFSKDEDLQCFIKCKQFKQGLVNENGEMQSNALEDMLKPFMTCGEEKGANPCETAYKIFRCNRKAWEELSIMLNI